MTLTVSLLSRVITLHIDLLRETFGLSWVKINENRSKGSEDMSKTRNSSVNSMTLTLIM